MNSPLDLLLQHLDAHHRHLWLADEAHGPALSHLTAYASQLELLSNRFNIAESATACGLTSHFSDWQLHATGSFDRVFLRICKEKPVNFHLINCAFNWLKPEGMLLLAGTKDEGVKSVASAAAKRFGSDSRLQKEGHSYWIDIQKPTSDPGTNLDSHSYTEIRPIGEWLGLPLYSKPGVYGWNKIDKGSELLVEQASRWLHQHEGGNRSLLDLGCGYGLLTLSFTDLLISRRVATDNNAAALACTAYNARARGLSVETVASDCADSIREMFDIVVCNPPFHSGFGVDADMTVRFLRAARRRLAAGGSAFFVVNEFIALEKKAAGIFGTVSALTEASGFKVWLLRP